MQSRADDPAEVLAPSDPLKGDDPTTGVGEPDIAFEAPDTDTGNDVDEIPPEPEDPGAVIS